MPVDAVKQVKAIQQILNLLIGGIRIGRQALVFHTVRKKLMVDILHHHTDITEVTEELLHTLVEKIVVHEKEVVDGKIIMRVDIYYRFIGKVGDKDGEALQAPKIRRNTKLLMEAGVLPVQ